MSYIEDITSKVYGEIMDQVAKRHPPDKDPTNFWAAITEICIGMTAASFQACVEERRATTGTDIYDRAMLASVLQELCTEIQHSAGGKVIVKFQIIGPEEEGS